MEDLTFVICILATIFLVDILLLLAYIIHQSILQRAPDGQSDSLRSRTIRTVIGCGLSLSNFTNVVCLTVYFHYIDVWLWEFCPTKMRKPDDCMLAADKWNRMVWWLTVPFVISHFMIFTSGPRVKKIERHYLELLYSPGAHAWSCALFQMSLLFSTPLAYPLMFFKHIIGETWADIGMILAIFTIAAYMIGIAVWIEGMVMIWSQPRNHRGSARRTVGTQHDASDWDLIPLENARPISLN